MFQYLSVDRMLPLRNQHSAVQNHSGKPKQRSRRKLQVAKVHDKLEILKCEKGDNSTRHPGCEGSKCDQSSLGLNLAEIKDRLEALEDQRFSYLTAIDELAHKFDILFNEFEYQQSKVEAIEKIFMKVVSEDETSVATDKTEGSSFFPSGPHSVSSLSESAGALDLDEYHNNFSGTSLIPFELGGNPDSKTRTSKTIMRARLHI